MDYKQLSKEVSYALRHAPKEYDLNLDGNGWVKVEELLWALKKRERWLTISINDLVMMIELSDKKRHEIVENKIRALYGHSLPSKVSKVKSEPPKFLYHGTARKFLESIKKQGLLPQDRQYVHLSVDKETAYEVGKRRDDKPVLLRIKAKTAHEKGISFYIGYEKIWLSDSIPCEFIEFELTD